MPSYTTPTSRQTRAAFRRRAIRVTLALARTARRLGLHADAEIHFRDARARLHALRALNRIETQTCAFTSAGGAPCTF